MGSEVIHRNRATAPKGQQNLAQGFNPGLITAKGCALKVAPDRVRPGYLAAESSVRIPSGAAFRALATLTSNPGLKPWAKSLCPFGAGPWAKSYRCFGALSSRPVLDLSPVTFQLSHSSL